LTGREKESAVAHRRGERRKVMTNGHWSSAGHLGPNNLRRGVEEGRSDKKNTQHGRWKGKEKERKSTSSDNSWGEIDMITGTNRLMMQRGGSQVVK